ncbi:hypothetical protein DSO57_1039096 [Entomophthora muscae]|uniref:Uncharacterized protein n=1 Tax=Entomophthora muscae TaxID=34485 RepID=A0ACC2TX65_9FUNG|nr:hypothetical protein DSO57_1039096 [Entomophthora muscae]
MGTLAGCSLIGHTVQIGHLIFLIFGFGHGVGPKARGFLWQGNSLVIQEDFRFMKFTEELSLTPLGNLRSSSLDAILIEPALAFWLQDLAGASACGGSISEKRRQMGSQSMGPAACRNPGSGFESRPWAWVFRGNELSILTMVGFWGQLLDGIS